jgi:hypothetical protein
LAKKNKQSIFWLKSRWESKRRFKRNDLREASWVTNKSHRNPSALIVSWIYKNIEIVSLIEHSLPFTTLASGSEV